MVLYIRELQTLQYLYMVIFLHWLHMLKNMYLNRCIFLEKHLNILSNILVQLCIYMRVDIILKMELYIGVLKRQILLLQNRSALLLKTLLSIILNLIQKNQEEANRAAGNGIVLMGIGEPLDNFDNVLRFLELVNHPDGLNIGMRHISLSTCGLTEKIDKLAEHRLQLTLSVSLHAPDDETRSRIMPVNRGVGVEKLFDTCRRYFETTGRRISYEYAMIDGVNDSDAQADLLARHLKGTPGHVNLIPLNEVRESPLKPSRRVAEFQRRLERQGVTVTVRRKLGGDIDASCGQLRRKAMGEAAQSPDGGSRTEQRKD